MAKEHKPEAEPKLVCCNDQLCGTNCPGPDGRYMHTNKPFGSTIPIPGCTAGEVAKVWSTKREIDAMK